MYTKPEALSIFRGWHERNTPLLLKLQPAAGAEPLFIKGRISHVVSDEFIFGKPALLVTGGFSKVGFEYEDLHKRVDKPASQRTSICELRLQLSAAQNPSFRDELITPETTVILLRNDCLIVLRAKSIWGSIRWSSILRDLYASKSI